MTNAIERLSCHVAAIIHKIQMIAFYYWIFHNFITMRDATSPWCWTSQLTGRLYRMRLYPNLKMGTMTNAPFIAAVQSGSEWGVAWLPSTRIPADCCEVCGRAAPFRLYCSTSSLMIWQWGRRRAAPWSQLGVVAHGGIPHWQWGVPFLLMMRPESALLWKRPNGSERTLPTRLQPTRWVWA